MVHFNHQTGFKSEIFSDVITHTVLIASKIFSNTAFGSTHCVQVLHDVLEGGVGPELLKELPLVQQRIDQVGVVVERVAQAGVDDFQHHADHLFNHIQVLGLGEREDVKVNWFPTTLPSPIMMFSF